MIRQTRLFKGIQLINGGTTAHPGLSDSKIHAPNCDSKLPVTSRLMVEGGKNPSFIINTSYVTCQKQTHISYLSQGPSVWLSFSLSPDAEQGERAQS